MAIRDNMMESTVSNDWIKGSFDRLSPFLFPMTSERSLSSTRFSTSSFRFYDALYCFVSRYLLGFCAPCFFTCARIDERL